ncbi:MAG: hypothetical protein ACM3SQ_12250 [Betaproteobacteria bacterium]
MTKMRAPQRSAADLVPATVHPSALLRAPDEETRHRETARFIEDLRRVARRLHAYTVSREPIADSHQR